MCEGDGHGEGGRKEGLWAGGGSGGGSGEGAPMGARWRGVVVWKEEAGRRRWRRARDGEAVDFERTKGGIVRPC